MFDSLFENRNKYVSSLIELGSCLGRSLRKNVNLYSIDSNKGIVHYLTEDGKLVYGDIKEENNTLFMADTKVVNTSVLEDSKIFDQLVLEEVENMITSVFDANYGEAKGEFSGILDLWKSRSKFERESKKLVEKTLKFTNTNIIDDPSFRKLDEIYENLVEFLTENRKKFLEITEISNSVRLSNVLAESFNTPKLSYEDLVDSDYKNINEFNNSIYEIVCSQELLSTELLEAKENFSNVWATNSKIKSLATCIFETNTNVVAERLSEAIEEVPFLALSSKKQLRKTIQNSLSLLETEVPDSEVQTYVSMLFEMKKPVKKEVLSFLNEKYGVSVQNLNDIPSFRSLLNTQVLLFESLQKLSPKGSLQKEVLKEVATMLKEKTGVESIDVNSYINILFEEAGFMEDLEIEPTFTSVSLDESVEGIDRIKELISLIGENYPLTEVSSETETAPEEKEGSPEESEEEAQAGEEDSIATQQGDFVTKQDFMSNLQELEELLQSLVDGDEPENDDEELDEPDSVEEGDVPPSMEKEDEESDSKDKKKKKKKKSKKDDESEDSDKDEQYEE